MDKQQKIDKRLPILEKAKTEYRDIAINQLSIANNLLLTLAVGFLTFSYDKKSVQNISFHLFTTIHWSTFLYLLYLLTAIISIILGIIVLITRLYDFRITKYIIKLRIKMITNNNILLNYNSHSPVSLTEKLNVVYLVIFNKVKSIDTKLIENYSNDRKAFLEQFSFLRKTAHILGEISINWTKWQAIFLVASIILLLTSSLT
jgi:hypothetical protein